MCIFYFVEMFFVLSRFSFACRVSGDLFVGQNLIYDHDLKEENSEVCISFIFGLNDFGQMFGISFLKLLSTAFWSSGPFLLVKLVKLVKLGQLCLLCAQVFSGTEIRTFSLP